MAFISLVLKSDLSICTHIDLNKVLKLRVLVHQSNELLALYFRA